MVSSGIAALRIGIEPGWGRPPRREGDWSTRDRLCERQADGEIGARPGRAFDRQAAAVAIETVLHQRQTEAGAALGAALADIDPVEPLGQARQVLRRDAGAIIANRHDRLPGISARRLSRQRELNELP